MARHPTKPGHKHTHVFGPERKVQRMTARHIILTTVDNLASECNCTIDEACELADIDVLLYMRACGDV